MKPKKKSIIIFIATFSYFFLFASIPGIQDGTTDVYEKAVRENNPERIVLPLFVIIAFPSYFLLGELAFILLPVAFLLIILFFLFKTFKEFNLSYYFIPAFFLIHLKAVQFIPQFSRDGLFFVLTMIYLYYFVLIFEKKKTAKTYLAILILVVVLMYLTKAIGMVFVAVTVFFFFKKFAWNKINGFLSLSFFDPYNAFRDGISQVINVTQNVWLIFVSPLFVPFFASVILNKSINGLIWFFVFLLSSYGALQLGHHPSTVYRYVFPLMGIALFYIALWVKQKSKRAVLVGVLLVLSLVLGVSPIYF